MAIKGFHFAGLAELGLGAPRGSSVILLHVPAVPARPVLVKGIPKLLRNSPTLLALFAIMYISSWEDMNRLQHTLRKGSGWIQRRLSTTGEWPSTASGTSPRPSWSSSRPFRSILTYVPPYYNLALLEEKRGRSRESRSLWEEYGRRDPASLWAERIRKHLGRQASRPDPLIKELPEEAIGGIWAKDP